MSGLIQSSSGNVMESLMIGILLWLGFLHVQGIKRADLSKLKRCSRISRLLNLLYFFSFAYPPHMIYQKEYEGHCIKPLSLSPLLALKILQTIAQDVEFHLHIGSARRGAKANMDARLEGVKLSEWGGVTMRTCSEKKS
ncbi:hypothetical protein BDZ97DRAFT_1870184 [Flammula alnicola]|nr:hypothetical protein BDZ97DRAFT_1870184 [Flammula alnicola]